jgi:hypothetical protein
VKFIFKSFLRLLSKNLAELNLELIINDLIVLTGCSIFEKL